MELIIGAHAVAAVLLTISGPRKFTDPTSTIEFLAGVGLPVSSRSRVAHMSGRGIGIFEILLGISALAAGGEVMASLVGAVYLVFGVLTWIALRRDVGSCACFGRSDTPPTTRHVVIDLVLSAASFAAVTADAPLDSIEDSAIGRVISVVLVGMAAGIVYRLLDASPAGREPDRGHRA